MEVGDEGYDANLHVYYDIGPKLTWSLSELKNNRSKVEAINPTEEASIDEKRIRLAQYDELISWREDAWSDIISKTLALLRIALRHRNHYGSNILSPSMASSMGAALSFPSDVIDIFECATRDQFSFDLAFRYCRLFLRPSPNEKEISLPVEVALFIQSVLDKELERPKAKGPHPLRHFGRDGFIVEMVELCLHEGFKPYRNEATETHSACDLVALICAEAGASISTYEAVRKVWSQRDKSGDKIRHYIYP